MKKYLTISASSLSTFFKCSQQYKWQFLDELEPDEGTASLYTVFGSAFHRAIELYFKFNLDMDEIRSCWKPLFLSFCTETKGLVLPRQRELLKFIDKGYLYFDNFTKLQVRWKNYKIVDTEKYYRLPFKTSLDDVFISGRIDLILNNDKYEFVCLDWKTSKTKETNVESNTQITFYVYIISQVYKIPLESIYGGLVYPFDMDILFSQRQSNDFDVLFKRVNVMLDRISKSDFVKEPKVRCTPDDCYFCQYTKTCEKI